MRGVAPSLSVVVAASDSTAAALRAVAGLPASAEVIVAADPGKVARPATVPAGVVWLEADPGTGVPRLRRLGLDRARGGVVAFTEDSCVFGPGWAGAWLAAFADPRVGAATGPVVPSMGDDPVDWAVFFCEYAPFLPASGPTRVPGRLAGNNFAVRRSRAGRVVGDEVHESEVYRAFAASPGAVVVADADAGHVRRYGLAEAVRDRLRFGFGYGRARASTLPPALRPLGLAVGPVVLAAQLGRLLVHVGRRRGVYEPFAASLPATLALLTAWSVGEWVGWASALRPASRKRHERAARPRGRGPGRRGSRRRRYRAAQPPA